MNIPRGAWAASGVVAAAAGLAVSHAAAGALTIRATPVVAVAELVIELTPGAVAEWLIQLVGTLDKPLLLVGVLLGLAGLAAYAGALASRSQWRPILVFVLMGAVGVVAVSTRSQASLFDVTPVVLGVVTWIVVLSFLTDPLRRIRSREEGPAAEADTGGPTRRGFLIRSGAVGAAALAVGVGGEVFGRGRRRVEETRRLLRLPITEQPAPRGAGLGVNGVAPWRTSNAGFYRIDTAVLVPTIDPKDWTLRIHGLVDNELTLTYEDLIGRELTQDWVTLTCVSNEVGGDLIGNAWWSGVRIADLLAEVGISADADAVLQTSADGWTCGTPLSALTDDRNAMLALGMNGEPLPIDHGFPVRMVVPGLYGYVSATKWVVDLEVTRFEDIEAFWTTRGWGEKGPIKTSSRIDVPRSGDEVPAGPLRVGGSAWAQHTGVERVEYAVDGGDWQTAALGRVPQDDTWVQWAGTAELSKGDHVIRVRATDKGGYVQTPVERDVLPDGATGWHSVDFSAT